jgi:hypothetical protein
LRATKVNTTAGFTQPKRFRRFLAFFVRNPLKRLDSEK